MFLSYLLSSGRWNQVQGGMCWEQEEKHENNKYNLSQHVEDH